MESFLTYLNFYVIVEKYLVNTKNTTLLYMTLFITTPRRRYEISDAYVMALTFLIIYGVTSITKNR